SYAGGRSGNHDNFFQSCSYSLHTMRPSCIFLARNLPVHAESIRSVDCEVFEFPLKRPEADGTERWDKTVLIVTRVHAGGEVGLGYTYGDPPVAQVVRSIL